MEIKAIPVKDRKNTDRWGNPKYILMIVEPPELRGLIAFPINEDIIVPGREYVVEIVKRFDRYAKVKIIRAEKYEIPIRKGAWRHTRDAVYKIGMLSPPSPPSEIRRLYVSLWDKNAYYEYFYQKAKGYNVCELHCSETITSDDDVWPGTKKTYCHYGDWLGRWRCTFSAPTNVIDFLWYVGGRIVYTEQEAVAIYEQLMKKYQEDLARYEEELFRLKSMIEDVKSDRIMVAGDLGITVRSVYDLLW